MLRQQTNENVLQFGKDSFRAYKEATVGAAIYIMDQMLSEPQPNFRPWVGNHSKPGAGKPLQPLGHLGGCLPPRPG
jgi:hypothetical protein